MDSLDINKKRVIELGFRYVNVSWKTVIEDEVELSILSGGYSSRLYLIEDKSKSSSNPTKKFLVRLYGGKLVDVSDPIRPDRSEIKETLVFYAVGLAGLGPRLYGSFDGGRVEEFVYSHMLTQADYDQRPETMLELARKLARFHALDLPISKERHQILDACEGYYQQRDLEQFRELAKHLGMKDMSKIEDFDVMAEIEWLKKNENVISGRIVTISGDTNKNNVLVRDELDKFGERVMIIDYELCARDFRGRDIGAVFAMKIIEHKDGYFSICCDYPDETWRRKFITEYLKQTKELNYFEWDEKLDSADHVLMEAEFFMFYIVQMIIGFFMNQKADSLFFKMEMDKARSMLDLTAHFIDVYHKRKSCFVKTYGKPTGTLLPISVRITALDETIMKISLLFYSKLILFLIAVIIASVQSYWRDFEFSGVENVKSGFLQTDLRVTRYNRTTIAVSGFLSIADDSQNYDCEGKVFRSTAGNNQYKLRPYKIARDSCCNLLESVYWKPIEARVATSSDLPKRINNEMYCITAKQGTYTLRNFVFDTQHIPKFSLPGSYRVDFYFYKMPDNELSTLRVFIKLL
ncbi:Choline/ethanolamine kinase [Pseudolycoriella hygida]|uniref:Choline/ethanolamine kinase n=1 Tax=Pseudolycoriella hygida TaxID=35572 RepID=A0A9Q0NCX5_9DIPT|nr:Choline/ethanolamine kinase [Pseudolycoriella hygida]